MNKQETTQQATAPAHLGQVERLVRLRPSGRSDKFSLNFYKYIKKYKCYGFDAFFSPWNLITGEMNIAYSPDKTIAPNIYIGVIDDEGWLFGARLSEIIRHGAKNHWAIPPKIKFVCVSDFWGRYAEFGKCAIDPEHNLYFPDGRYTMSEDGQIRVCNWCGRSEKLHIKERVIKDKVWMPA